MGSKWVKMGQNTSVYFSISIFSFLLFSIGNMLKRRDMELKMKKTCDLTPQNDQNVIFRSNAPKWCQNGSKWVKMPLFILTLYFSDTDFFIFAFFDREHAETSRNDIQSEKKG